ncbi:MAG TPA: protein phosphatase 2C domain-containing protein [Bryobacteraceae bacterium]|jgi:protein phosphatase|nr:protein phosphatase 2C domain-containing protein [Bryobacteraceae bacterium]
MFAGAPRVRPEHNPNQPLSSALDLEYFEMSDAGRVRGHNEDYLGCAVPASEAEGRTQGWLFALADGVGGEERGEVASQTAVETLVEGFRAAPKGEPHGVLLPRITQAANTKIYELGRASSPGGSRMATTVVACALRYDRVVVAHVGDSRCYLIRHGIASQITRDHTVVAEQQRLGLLTEKEAAEATTRHLLSRSLGSDLFVNVEIDDRQVQARDVLLLCSDGLHGPVKGSEMAEIVTWHPVLETAAARLIALANERDGGDNVSVQLIRVHGVERMGMYRGRPYKLR